MDTNPLPSSASPAYLLRFRSLFNDGRGYAFPCNAHGQVDLGALGEQARRNYLCARAEVGSEYGTPWVEPMPH